MDSDEESSVYHMDFEIISSDDAESNESDRLASPNNEAREGERQARIKCSLN